MHRRPSPSHPPSSHTHTHTLTRKYTHPASIRGAPKPQSDGEVGSEVSRLLGNRKERAARTDTHTQRQSSGLAYLLLGLASALELLDGVDSAAVRGQAVARLYVELLQLNLVVVHGAVEKLPLLVLQHKHASVSHASMRAARTLDPGAAVCT